MNRLFKFAIPDEMDIGFRVLAAAGSLTHIKYRSTFIFLIKFQ